MMATGIKRLLLVALLTPLACGDKVQTGIFNDGLVNGLHYQTPTEQGLTTAKGEFKYKDGETVTFSIGGIALGSHKAAARVTAFDLAGIKVPSSEAELGPKLRNQTAPFVTAVNIAFLLDALDKDGTIANGVDLTGLDETLADAQLSVGSSAFAAQYATMATRYSLRDASSIPVGAPLQHVYDVLQLHLPVPRRSDGGRRSRVAMESTEQRQSVQYDATTGLRSSSTADSNGDGTNDGSATYTYDAAGRMLSGAVQSTQGTASDSTHTLPTYTANGDIATNALISHSNGVQEENLSITATYGPSGNVLGR